MTEKNTEPAIRTSLNWSPTRKLSCSADFRFYSGTPDANQSGDVMVRESELMYVAGNPYLKNWTSTDASLYGCLWFSRQIAAIMNIRYERQDNRLADYYTQPGDGLDGLVRTTENSAPQDNYAIAPCIYGYFLNNSLVCNIGVSWRHDHTGGKYAASLHSWRAEGDVSYRFRNFQTRIRYEGPQKSLYAGGMGYTRRSGQWTCEISYGNGNFYAKARVEDVFNRHKDNYSVYNSEFYSRVMHDFKRGRTFSLNFSYTFGYGKKVDESIDVSKSRETESAKINSGL